MSEILKIDDISKSFGGVKAVQNVSMSIKQGSIVSVIGPNGAGKTTVFNLISGIYPIDNGSIILDGKNITNKEQHIVTSEGIGRTFQNIRLFKGLNALENVMTAYDPIMKYNLFDSMIGSPKKRKLDKENEELSTHFLDIVGLYEYRHSDPFSLPYGYQRKLEIARALATYPKVLLLDEPGAGLNTVEVLELIELIEKLKNELDLTIILIDHRMELIMKLSNYIYVLNFGELLAEGNPEEIQNNKKVMEAYMGESD